MVCRSCLRSKRSRTNEERKLGREQKKSREGVGVGRREREGRAVILPKHLYIQLRSVDLRWLVAVNPYLCIHGSVLQPLY